MSNKSKSFIEILGKGLELLDTNGARSVNFQQKGAGIIRLVELHRES